MKPDSVCDLEMAGESQLLTLLDDLGLANLIGISSSNPILRHCRHLLFLDNAPWYMKINLLHGGRLLESLRDYREEILTP